MQTSESINELVKALAKTQGELDKASKNANNPFHKSKYAKLEDVWDACREPLSANGLCVIQAPSIGVGSEVVLTTRLAHTSGQWVETQLSIKPQSNNAQGVGSAITYAKRYSLAAIVGIADGDDDDGNIATFGDKSQSKRVSQETLKRLESLLADRDVDKFSKWIEEKFKVRFENLNNLKQHQAESIIEAIERKSND
jgi:hypothetical protein